MGNAAEQYANRARGEGISPSGQKFIWKLATTADHVAVLDGVPSLGLVKTIKAGELTAELMSRARSFNAKLIARCVVSPRIVLTGDVLGDDVIHYDLLTNQDADWLLERVQLAPQLEGEKADAARGVL